MAQKKKKAKTISRIPQITPENKREKKKNEERKKKALKILGAVMGYILFTVVLFLSFYSRLLGLLGDFFKNIFMGLFGKTSYAFPFALVYFLFYYFKQKKKKEGYSKIYILCGIFITMSILFDIFAYGNYNQPLIIEVFYKDGIDFTGGGILGGFIGEPIKRLLTFTGSAIVGILVLLFLLFMFFQEPLMVYIENAKEKAKKEKEIKKQEAEKKAEKEKEEALKREKTLPSLENTLVTDDISDIDSPEEEFNEMMKIYNEYDEKEINEEIDDVIDMANKTDLETEIYDEKRKLDEILGKKEETQLSTVKVDDKVEEIVVSPLNKKIEYKYPSVELLEDNKATKNSSISDLKEKAIKLENILENFGVDAEVVNIEKGPSITRFELQPKSGVRLSKIQSLQEDIKMNLAAASIRISPIPGKTVVGIEIPNDKTTPVFIKDIITTKEFQDHKSKIAFTVGMDITGKPVVGDLAKMPHVLIAGATGSGKSVCINTLITSILYKANPNEVKLIMVDPKVVELGVYNGIPHLLIPVVTDPKKAAGALNWAVMEMQNRYKLFAETGVRNITGYNELMESSGEEESKLPQIVIIIDELADLMMIAPKDVEGYICRLAQLARAAGMHLVIATQRPSVNVITGLIKANIPSRIAFAVTSQIDSRTILDIGGAEKLLGKGDMLYYPAGESKPERVQGSFISDSEVERIVNVVKANSSVEYNEDIIEHMEREQAYEGDAKSKDEEALDADELLPQAIEVVLEANQASTSLLQRRLKLGYARAARIVDQMEARGIVGPSEGSKPRQILITKEQYYEMQLNS